MKRARESSGEHPLVSSNIDSRQVRQLCRKRDDGRRSEPGSDISRTAFFACIEFGKLEKIGL